VRGILADINVRGQVRAILSIWNSDVWREIWLALGLSRESFPSLGLSLEASDALIWRTCQRVKLVLITANRNDEGPESLTGHLKAIIINFYAGNKPSVDVDNMSKPILDEMEKIVYHDDRQIIQAGITHLRIGAAFSIAGVSKVLVTALQAGSQFVYVRIEDPVDPFPLSN